MQQIYIVMKRILILLFLLPLCAMAQIDIRQSEVRNVPVSKPVIYDSLAQFTIKHIDNFKGNYEERLTAYRNQFKQYLGQDIFFIPYPSKKDSDIEIFSSYINNFKFYYPNKYNKFVVGKQQSSTPIKETKDGKTVYTYPEYEVIDSTNLYKAKYLLDPSAWYFSNNKDRYFATPYSAYMGHYFKIVDLLFDNENVCLVLLDDNNDTVIYSRKSRGFNTDNPSHLDFPEFILVGYYLKMKELHVGKDYICYNTGSKNTITTDINTGEDITLYHESEWHCSSLEFVDLHNAEELQLYLIFNNKNGNCIKVRIDNRKQEFDPLTLHKFKNKQDYLKQKELEKLQNAEKEKRLAEEKARKEKERLELEKMIINKYGEYYGGFIIKGQVILGMSTEMCRYAWGEPSRINTTIVEGLKSEQWVYSLYSYLYFDNGKLTAIQN